MVKKWRKDASAVKTLSSSEFAQRVVEHGLRVATSGGYEYAAIETEDGYDLIRAFRDWDAIPVSDTQTANPAAGAQPAASYVPAGKQWLIVGASVTLNTDANVADRYPYLQMSTDGTYTLISMQPTPITASITGQFVSFAAGCSPGGAIGNSLAYGSGIGDGIVLSTGGWVRLQLLGIQAADDLAIVTYFYKEADLA